MFRDTCKRKLEHFKQFNDNQLNANGHETMSRVHNKLEIP